MIGDIQFDEVEVGQCGQVGQMVFFQIDFVIVVQVVEVNDFIVMCQQVQGGGYIDKFGSVGYENFYRLIF